MARWAYIDDLGRRGWAEGSIYRTSAGKWRVAVSLGRDPFGKRIRKEWQVRSQAAAERKLKDVRTRLRSGLPAEESRMTVAAYSQEWLSAVKPTVKPSTYHFYETLARLHLEEIAYLPLVAVSPQEIRRLITKRLSEGYSTRTVRGVLDVLRMILKQAVNDGILTRNVAELVTPPKLEQADPVHFTADEARRFLDVARQDHVGSLYAVALGSGLRRGELLGLSWRDFDRDTASVAVRRGKTSSSVRVVPLAGFARDALLALAMEGHGLGPIWPYDPTYVTRHFQALCRKAGVPVLTFHQLRHTAASLMLDAGVDPLVIQQILGHSKVAMTAHYARSGDALRRDAVEKLGRAIA